MLATETGLNVHLYDEDMEAIHRGLRMRGHVSLTDATIRGIAAGFMPFARTASYESACDYVYRRCVALS